MKPLAEPIPLAESRALADRLLAPYLLDQGENDDEDARLFAIVALGEFDVNRALELFEHDNFREDDRRHQRIRGSLAAKLAVTEPARADAMVESLADPQTRALALLEVIRARTCFRAWPEASPA